MPLRHTQVVNRGVGLHCALAGDPDSDRAPLVLLHGFPDHWESWRGVMEAFGSDRLVVAPDGRGINLSDKPIAVDAYHLDVLVSDVAAVVAHFAADGAVDLIGHDWGGVVAWSMATIHPEKVRKLVVMNAPHPAVMARFAREPRHAAAFAYVDALRSPGAEARLSATDFKRMRAIYAELRAAGSWTDGDDVLSVAAWSRPGALTGALNWYRAADFAITGGRSPIEATRLTMPALLLWGADDKTFLPDVAFAHEGLAAPLSIEMLNGCGHWPHLQRPADVVDRVRRFLA